MIRVVIGDVESELSKVTESWINQHINRRKADRQNVCVKVIIKENNLDMVLSTPACAFGQTGRRPNEEESAIFKIWELCGLNNENFTGGNLIDFLKKYKRL